MPRTHVRVDHKLRNAEAALAAGQPRIRGAVTPMAYTAAGVLRGTITSITELRRERFALRPVGEDRIVEERQRR